jgi:twitching motility two-component system response regulator PilG
LFEVKPHTMSESSAALKIFVLGFAEAELRLLEAAVRLSERRKPPLALLERADCEQAAVWLIDGHAPVEDKKWAVRTLRTLPDKVVIWVDAAKIPANHTALQRPIAWVNLPAILGKAIESQSQAADFKTQDASMSVPASGKHEILVVDDSAPARQHLRGLLQSRGFAVLEADSAEAALAQLQQESAYAAVLMDIMLPGIDGYEACRQIRAQHPHLPVIMLTSRASPFDRIRGSMAGCNAYLTKPPDPQELYDLLNKYNHTI